MDDASQQQLLFDAITDAQSGGGSADVIPAPGFGDWGVDIKGMNRDVKPGDDFFEYVNGSWAKNTPIPADRSNFGVFHGLRDLSEARVRKLVEAYAPGNPATDGDSAKVAAIYRGFMDEAAIEKLGIAPIEPELDAVRNIKDKRGMATLMGESNGQFGGSLFGMNVGDD